MTPLSSIIRIRYNAFFYDTSNNPFVSIPHDDTSLNITRLRIFCQMCPFISSEKAQKRDFSPSNIIIAQSRTKRYLKEFGVLSPFRPL
jgi:hypothetical protein